MIHLKKIFHKAFSKKSIKTLSSTLRFGVRELGGRNSDGCKIFRRKALTKRLYRFLDIKRKLNPGVSGRIIKPYLYDANRTGYFSLILYINGVTTQILAPQYKNQNLIYNLITPQTKQNNGWSNFLNLIPAGTIVYNIEQFPGSGGIFARSAGVSAILLRKDSRFKKFVVIKLRSGEQRFISKAAIGCVGAVSNAKHFITFYKNAGAKRHAGYKPRTRAIAMNAVDHPMGGRTKGGIKKIKMPNYH